MAFIETLAAEAVSEQARPMYERQRAHYGYVPNYAKVFCHRPEVMERWAALLAAIKRPMDKRRFELATFAAARALRSTLCTLAHGKALTEFFSVEDVRELGAGRVPASLTNAEVALMAFAHQVAHAASAVTYADIERLRAHGFGEAEIFDIAATAAGRAFFSKVIESLGVEADPPFREMQSSLRAVLTVGRPLDFAEPVQELVGWGT
jgi:uncharacterized peroxidase-related enzyme